MLEIAAPWFRRCRPRARVCCDPLRYSALGLAVVALPKLCCVVWLAALAVPAVATSIKLVGLGATAAQIDSLCRTGAALLPPALDIPTLWALFLLTTALLILGARWLWRFERV